MRFRNMLKGSKASDDDNDYHDQRHQPTSPQLHSPSSPEFTFIRTDSMNQEIVTLSDAPSSPLPYDSSHLSPPHPGSKPRRSMDAIFGSRSRTSSVSSGTSSTGEQRRRLSQRLHLSRQPEASQNVPADMPAMEAGATEAQWEKRATMLAGQNGLQRTRSKSILEEDEPVPQIPPVESMGSLRLDSRAASPSPAASLSERRSPVAVSSKQIDADIQEAVRLHEDGDYERSTRLFEKLADAQGANNALSQVLFGLALRHGWGIEADPERAVQYLTAAASNAASIEQLALQAGMAKGGAAKGELVLAIFELANCFRHGWGIAVDPVAAKQYYETAANLGDTDAMNEVAWCYLEGFGCKKDKYMAAKYYRKAEDLGVKIIGNTWIWKPKYDNPPKSKSKK